MSYETERIVLKVIGVLFLISFAVLVFYINVLAWNDFLGYDPEFLMSMIEGCLSVTATFLLSFFIFLVIRDV